MTITKDDLSSFEIDVLEALTQSAWTVSAVTIAADLWRPGSMRMGGDPVGLVQWTLEGLNEKGLVNYRIKEVSHVVTREWHKDPELVAYAPYERLATHVRLSRDGWALMGYPIFHVQVNSRLSTMQRLDAHGDRTNFRKHNYMAEGGPIITETFLEHRVNFPHHIHMYEGDDEMAERRRYVRITDELERGILDYRDANPNSTIEEMSEALAYSERTLRYVLYDLPRIRRNSNEESDHSQKQRIMWALRAMDYDNITELRKTLGRADTSHDIVHALHDLHSEGLVDFIEKSGGKEPVRIHITERGRSWANKQDTPSVANAVEDAFAPDTQDPDDPSSVAFGSDIPTYPELDALLAREKQRLDSDNRGMRYIEAAELIRENDPETAALLDAKAAESNIPFPSPLEAEYMRYVADHP